MVCFSEKIGKVPRKATSAHVVHTESDQDGGHKWTRNREMDHEVVLQGAVKCNQNKMVLKDA